MAHQLVQGISSPEELFSLLEKTNSRDIVSEIKQLIHEQFSDVKDSWLVYGLFDFYASTKSSRCLEILLSVKDPHEKYLCDKITECLRQTGKQRLLGMEVFGCVVRKHPSWLYKIMQFPLIKDLLKILKSEEDLVIMMNGLLSLIALLPTLPVHVVPFLGDIFEIFSRVASWRCFRLKKMPEIQQVHIQVALFAFFHRLYGMFPCNFLSYLRTQYSDEPSKDSHQNDEQMMKRRENQAVFLEAIRPMLGTVRMHPLLVTHSRDREKAPSRWKKMEIHDVMVESSKYSLVKQESTTEDFSENAEDHDHLKKENGQKFSGTDLSTEIHKLLKHEPLWTPTRICGVSTPPRNSAAASLAPGVFQGKHPISPSVIAPLTLESPPEPAIEATPESTPFVTPVKEDHFRYCRTTPSSQSSRQLRLDSISSSTMSPGNSATNSGNKSISVPSPLAAKDVSPFRFPDILMNSRASNAGLPDLRRDSLFETGGQPAKFGLSRMSIDRGSSTLIGVATGETVGSSSNTLTPDTSLASSVQTQIAASSLSAVAVSSSALLASAGHEPKKPDLTAIPPVLESNQQHRPSPVKFTNQRPEQFPIMPKPERASSGVEVEDQKSDLVRHKMLSLETLKDALPDFGKEEQDDDEVTKLTGGSDDPSSHQLGTRHITPQFYSGSSSTANSRTTSRLSSSSQADKSSRPTTSTLSVEKGNQSKEKSACKFEIPPVPSGDSKGVSKERVSDFVRQAKGRIRNVTISGLPESETDIETSSGVIEQDGTDKKQSPPRALSCPNFKGSEGKKINGHCEEELAKVDESKSRTVEIQTDDATLYSYEHLFPEILPQWMEASKRSGKDEIVNPYDLLDQFMKASANKLETAKGTAEVDYALQAKLLQAEVSMLEATVHFERHRREALGNRNRRLLGKTRAARAVEEQNTALRDQLNMVAAEMEILYDELEAVRKEKHAVEEDRAANAKQRDKEIERLVHENNKLQQDKLQLKGETERQEEKLKAENIEMQKLQASYFNSAAEVNILMKKDELRAKAEDEVVELRKEILLLGELLRKYREKSIPPAGSESAAAKQQSLFLESFKNQIHQMEETLQAKTREVVNANCRVLQLEEEVQHKDQAIAELKRLLERAKEENKELIRDAEESYNEVVDVNLQLEKQILEARGQPKRPSSSEGSVPIGAGGARAGSDGSPTSPEFGEVLNDSGEGLMSPSLPSESGAVIAYHSANVDIACKGPAHRAPEKPSSFVIGSPPSSGEGVGLDHSEMIRRALASREPLNLDRALSGEESTTARSSDRLETVSPEFEPVISAKEILDSSGSFNGHSQK